MNKKYIFFKILFLINLFVSVAYGQENTAIRSEIDKKREALNNNYSSPEVILRSREFVRMDSSYYVGYFCEANFRFERAADQRGYQEAIPYLRKALNLFEADYEHVLKDIYKSSTNYQKYNNRMLDYVIITDKLMDCYSNLEKPDSVILVLEHYKSWNFQYDYIGADNYIAWTYHRNRFYTSNRYKFLSDSVMGNERIALAYLKNNEAYIDKNAAANEAIMPYYRVLGSKMSVYHYMAIVYSYLRNPDSAKYYYRRMEPYNIFPYNNYAIFCYVNGSFNEAEYYFEHSMFREKDNYRLQEPYYYLSIINALRAKPYKSVKMLEDFIEEQGVRPGWGWYNIALGRSYLYNGQLSQSKEVLDKALRFKEIHIGTTLGESHYNFSRDILTLMNLENQVEAIKFENKHYWLSFTDIKNIAKLKLDIFNRRIALFKHLSNNPEREELYYRLFASEGTTSFDETYYLIKDYGRSFFIKNFEKQYNTDERANIKKYFLLLQGKLLHEQGKSQQSIEVLTKALEEDYEHEEMLFRARLYEGLALAYKKKNKEEERIKYTNLMYETFPQLMPFSNVKMTFNLIHDEISPELQKTIKELNNFNISFTVNKKDYTGAYNIYLGDYDDSFICSVENSSGNQVLQFIEKTDKDSKLNAKKIAYSIFKVGTKQEEDSYDY